MSANRTLAINLIVASNISELEDRINPTHWKNFNNLNNRQAFLNSISFKSILMQEETSQSLSKKELLEIEKLQKEIRALDNPFRWSPFHWSAMFSFGATLALLLSGWLSGWFSDKNDLIEIKNNKLVKLQDSLRLNTNLVRDSFISLQTKYHTYAWNSKVELDSLTRKIDSLTIITANLEKDKTFLLNQNLSDSRLRKAANNALQALAKSNLSNEEKKSVPVIFTGAIIDEVTGNCISDVKIVGTHSEEENQAITDQFGRFSIKLFPCNDCIYKEPDEKIYSVEISKKGYESTFFSFSGESISQIITINPVRINK